LEKSAGGVVYYDAGGDGPIYLLMSNRKGYWEFPKGHVDNGETEEEAAIREVREETGLNEVSIIPGFKTRIKYTYTKNDKRYPKEVVFFLMKANPKRVEVSEEHTGYVWLKYEEAMKKISYDNARKVLEKAHKFLMKGGSV
jgi:8-oxo-dGTP pyrophosphatase MutT (NUDIX family)